MASAELFRWLDKHPNLRNVVVAGSILGVLGFSTLVVIVVYLGVYQGREISLLNGSIRVGPGDRQGQIKQQNPGQARIIYGYDASLANLASVVSKAKRSIWTVRTHVGESSKEDPFYDAFLSRVLDPTRPMEDVRRNIRLIDSPRPSRPTVFCTIESSFRS